MKAGTYADRYSPEQIDSYYRSGLWSAETLHDLLKARAATTPDKVFATDGEQSATYGAMYNSALRLATEFYRRGWRAGDVVAVQLPNWVEFIQIVFALSRIGVITVPIMPVYRRDEVNYVLTHAEVRAVFTPAVFKDHDYLNMYLGVRQEIPDLEIVVVRPTPAATDIVNGDDGLFELSALHAEVDVVAAESQLGPTPGPDEPFVVVYTSGTTSRPKGCVHTFNTYCSTARGLSKAFGYTAADVQFGPSPVTHTTGLVTSVLLPLLNGASTHVMADWEPARALEEIKRFGCTATVTATTFLQMLMTAYDPHRHDPSSLRLWVCAGSPIPTAIVERANRTLPSVKVLSLYGRSENLTTTTCTVTDHPRRALMSDGSAMPGAEVIIVGPDGSEVARGTEGDIAYRGPSHMIEYLDNPEETAKLFTPAGYSRSGDLGRMTEDGYVRVTGRTKDIIVRGGMNISVREVEDALTAHPLVQSVAVVAMPDVRLGERVCCFAVPTNAGQEPTLEQLRIYLIEQGIAVQKAPERLVVVAALPTTATGKVQKHVLRKQIEATLEREHASVSTSASGD